MAIRPEISLLAAQMPGALSGTADVLASNQEMNLRKQALQQEQDVIQRDMQTESFGRLSSAIDEIMKASSDPLQRQQMASQMVERLGLNLPPEAYDSPDDFTDDALLSLKAAFPSQASLSGGEKFSATTVNLPGGVTVQTTNTGRKVVSDVNGNILQGEAAREAIAQAEEKEIQTLRAKSDVDVEESERNEAAKLKAKRSSDFITEISTRNRQASRDQRRIREALTLSAQSGEGLSAAAKVKLSKLLPSIDVGDEAALDSALNQLALDQLQNFKGPTTDFEYGVTQNIVGSVSDPKTARNAKLKSLERASWFNQREYDQFVRHQRNGGSADNFRFNFGEEVKTKKGVFTLQDLQDTAVANNISITDVLQRLNR